MRTYSIIPVDTPILLRWADQSCPAVVHRRVGSLLYLATETTWPTDLPDRGVIEWGTAPLVWRVHAHWDRLPETPFLCATVLTQPVPVVPANRRSFPRYTIHWPLRIKPTTWSFHQWQSLTEDLSLISSRVILPQALDGHRLYRLTLQAPDTTWTFVARIVRQDPLPADQAAVIFQWDAPDPWRTWWDTHIAATAPPSSHPTPL